MAFSSASSSCAASMSSSSERRSACTNRSSCIMLHSDESDVAAAASSAAETAYRSFDGIMMHSAPASEKTTCHHGQLPVTMGNEFWSCVDGIALSGKCEDYCAACDGAGSKRIDCAQTCR